MRIELPFGEGTLTADGPWDLEVYRSRPGRPLPDPDGACREALEGPRGTPALAEMSRGKRDAVIVISDVTRPVPNRIILPPIIDALRQGGIPDDRIGLLVATGTHRANTEEEMEGMVGAEILRGHPWRCHDAMGEGHIPLGEISPSLPLAVDGEYLGADLKVLTGLIQPHMLAGYSGGRKAVVPGLVDIGTLRGLHGFAMVASSKTAYGVLDGNPFHEAALRGARMAGADFILNVTLDPDGRPTGFFGGDLDEAHREGCRFVGEEVSVPVAALADVGITSGGGDPMDLTLYQSIKGLVALRPFVRPGGAMLLVARCSEGPGPEDFARLLLQAAHPGAFLRDMARPGFFRKDQWMIQELCSLGREWSLHCVTDGLGRRTLPPWVTPHRSLPAAMDALVPAGVPVAVLPDGPRDTPVPARS